MSALQVIYCGVSRRSSCAEVFAGHGHDRDALVAEYAPIFSVDDEGERPAVELWLVPDPSVCHVPERPKSIAAGGRYVWHWRVAQDHPQAQPFTAFFEGEWPIDLTEHLRCTKCGKPVEKYQGIRGIIHEGHYCRP